MKTSVLICTLLLLALPSTASDLPDGYWPTSKSEPILEKARTITLAPDLSGLTDGETVAVDALLEAGKILHDIYLDSRHPEALSARRALMDLHAKSGEGKETQNLIDLYRLNKGPIATTLENERVAFLPVVAQTAARNVYPQGATREAIDAFLDRHPEERSSILGERTVVRQNSEANLDHDLGVLATYPVLDVLHPGLAKHLRSIRSNETEFPFYAVPQSVNWAEQIIDVHRLLNEAADAVEPDDEEFARFLRNRSRDLLSDDYESGDASWVTGHFKTLNAQIGSYETYDDALYGVKAFMSLSLLKRNEEESAKLRKAIAGIQPIEDSLPYDAHKRVREDIPVGVYEIIADFGQSRGGNTATILPNDALFSRRYGRTILLRENIMRNPTLFTNTKAGWDAVVAPSHRDDLREDGNFNRTLWHEIGHYLGVDRDVKGRSLDVALESTADSYEEMKADLVSLFAAEALRASGYHTDESLESVYASGILRTLQTVQPRRDQPYQTMQLMQFNWFIDKGLLTFDRKAGVLTIHYDRYHDVVASLLKEVLAIQRAGDRDRAEAFMDKWTGWTPELHEVIAQKRRNSLQFRSLIVTYAALGE